MNTYAVSTALRVLNKKSTSAHIALMTTLMLNNKQVTLSEFDTLVAQAETIIEQVMEHGNYEYYVRCGNAIGGLFTEGNKCFVKILIAL